MDEAHKELIAVGRKYADGVDKDRGFESGLTDCLRGLSDALEAQAAEIERLTTNGVHTCHDQCQRPLCKSYREIVAAKKHGKLLNKMLGEAEAERDRLKAALEDAKEMVISWGSYAPTYFAEKHDLLGDVERLNKALGDAS